MHQRRRGGDLQFRTIIHNNLKYKEKKGQGNGTLTKGTVGRERVMVEYCLLAVSRPEHMVLLYHQAYTETFFRMESWSDLLAL
jgi:hypothetical protein